MNRLIYILLFLNTICIAQSGTSYYYDLNWNRCPEQKAVYVREVYFMESYVGYVDYEIKNRSMIQQGNYTDTTMTVKTGQYTKFYPQDSTARFAKQHVLIQGTYCDNKPCGEWKTLSESENILASEFYSENGKKEGLFSWYSYFRNSYSLDSTKTYSNDILTNETYFSDGIARASFYYTNGMIDSVIFKDEFDSVISGNDVNDHQPAYFEGGEKYLNKIIKAEMQYPAEAKKNKISGTVVVRFDVDKTGAVENIRIHKSVHPLLDEEAIRVVSLLGDFVPATKNNCPVKSTVDLEIDF